LGGGDSDDDDDDAVTAGSCDYVVALESDNTIEIISSEDGQLINVRGCRHGGGGDDDDDEHAALEAATICDVKQSRNPPLPPQVISPELCREELHRSLARAGTAQSAVLSLPSAASSVIGVVVVVVVVVVAAAAAAVVMMLLFSSIIMS
jgi:hypothetical protein